MSLLLKLLSFFPLFLLRGFGNLLGLYLWHTHSQSRIITEINLQLCFPTMPPQQQQKLARQSLMESGKTALEMAALWFWSLPRLKKLIKKVSGEHYLQDALQQSRGVIILTPHLGNWEAVGTYLAQHCTLTALYAPTKISAMNEVMCRGRMRNGYRLAPTSASGVKQLLKALKAREVIGILPDQVPDPESGVFAPFFGEPALTMTLVANLAARTGAVVLCCYAKRLQDQSGFEICLKPAAKNISSADMTEAVTALNRSVESCVLDCPEQYQWQYKRFRKRPAGISKLY